MTRTVLSKVLPFLIGVALCWLTGQPGLPWGSLALLGFAVWIGGVAALARAHSRYWPELPGRRLVQAFAAKIVSRTLQVSEVGCVLLALGVPLTPGGLLLIHSAEPGNRLSIGTDSALPAVGLVATGTAAGALFGGGETAGGRRMQRLMIRADQRILGQAPISGPRRKLAARSEESAQVDSCSLSGVSAARTNKSLSGRTAMLACVTLAMAGLFACPVSAAAGQQFTSIEQLTEKAEKQILKETDGQGQIVRLNEGTPGRGIHLSIHGLGADPSAMAPLTRRAEAREQTTATFVYDDFHGDQKQNAQSLASELKGWVAEHPGEKITIETHSLGGRTILAAFHYLQETGEMPKTAIQLNMVSPPLAGFGLLNLALPLPIPVAKLIPGAAASRDMASGSGAQDLLETVRLPENVKTTVFYGDNDHLIDYTTKGAKKMAENLNAQVYYLAGEHKTTVPAVAAHSINEFSTQPLTYKPHERNRHHEFGPHHH